MMDPEDMTILVAAIFQAQFVGRSTKENVHDARDFVREAEQVLRKDRATRRRQHATDFVNLVSGAAATPHEEPR